MRLEKYLSLFMPAFGGGGGGSQPTSSTNVTTTKSEPPEYVKPYNIDLLNRAGTLSNQPYTPYPGQQVAPLNPLQQQGLEMTGRRAGLGSPLVRAAQTEVQRTAQGDYLNPATNPAWAPMSKAITDAYSKGTAAQTDSAFARAGAFGGSAYQDQTQTNQKALADSLGLTAGNLYNSERLNQLRATQQAPELAREDYADAQAVLGMGDVYRQNEQEVLNQQYQQWLQQQQWPYQNLDVLANGIRTSMGGGGSSITTAPNPFQPSRTAGILGGGLLGYGIGSQFQNPYAGPVGAGLGALGGYLSY
jgi:hypothetical protein